MKLDKISRASVEATHELPLGGLFPRAIRELFLHLGPLKRNRHMVSFKIMGPLHNGRPYGQRVNAGRKTLTIEHHYPLPTTYYLLTTDYCHYDSNRTIPLTKAASNAKLFPGKNRVGVGVL